MIEKTTTGPSRADRLTDNSGIEASGADKLVDQVSVVRISKRLFVGAFLIVFAIPLLMGIITNLSGARLPRISNFIPLVLLVSIILIKSILVYKMWAAIQDGHTRTSPGKAVGFLFIPYFNLYWVFRAFWGFAKDYNAFVSRYSIDVPKSPTGLFLAYCILTILLILVPVSVARAQTPVLAFLPFVIAWYAVGLFMIMKICDAVNALPAEKIRAIKSGTAVPARPFAAPQGALEASEEETGAIEGERPPERTVPDMKKELRNWGIGLIVLGAIHLFVKFLASAWGVVIIAIGILNLFVPKRGMFILNGIVLLFVGIMNIVAAKQAGQGGWGVFGILQIVWGVQEIRKFKRYASSGGLEKVQEPPQ
ncbi:MAG: hypothetical protein PVG99_06135 [Desulfobacteraceae bacterium]|jgi:hypothetical protein